MYLREKLDELDLIKNKIFELKNYVCQRSNLTDEERDNIVKDIIGYIDKIQNIKLVLNKVNNQTTVEIANSELDLKTAVIIKNSIKEKIDLITDFINNSNNNLDVLTLMSQRDELINEFDAVNNSIRIADWSIKID